MNDTIPKNLFMVWLGDEVPDYVAFSMSAYKQANPEFNVKLAHFTIMQLEDIYAGKLLCKDDQIMADAINKILKQNDDDAYVKFFKHQLPVYGNMVRFVQILSDIYRMRLVSEYGGIYVDCDTFPLKPFDQKLLETKSFMVYRHYRDGGIGDDNYFFGSIPGLPANEHVKLLQTTLKTYSSLQYMQRKVKFFNMSLKYAPYLDQPFYIEHYCDGNWKPKSGKIRTPKTSFDKLEFGQLSSDPLKV